MKANKRLFIKLIFLLSLSFSTVIITSCYPEFMHPIPPPKQLNPDSKILGLWFRTTENDKQQLSIFPRKNGWVDIVYVYDINSKTSEDGINILVFEGYTTFVEEKKFLCFRPRSKDYNKLYNKVREKFSFIIVNYYVSDEGNLIVKHLSTDKIINLVNNGQLKGQVYKKNPNEGRFNDSVKVESSSDDLLKVICKKGTCAFLDESEQDTMLFSRDQIW